MTNHFFYNWKSFIVWYVSAKCIYRVVLCALWGCMGDWKCSPANRYPGTMCRWVVSLCAGFFASRKRASGICWIGGTAADLDTWGKIQIFSLCHDSNCDFSVVQSATLSACQQYWSAHKHFVAKCVQKTFEKLISLFLEDLLTVSTLVLNTVVVEHEQVHWT
jgi:hypothetical protein